MRAWMVKQFEQTEQIDKPRGQFLFDFLIFSLIVQGAMDYQKKKKCRQMCRGTYRLCDVTNEEKKHSK